MAIKYDPTINLGHVLTFVGFILAGSAAYYNAETDIKLNTQDIKAQHMQIDDVRMGLRDLSDKQDKRMDRFQDQINSRFDKLDGKIDKAVEATK